MTFNFHDGSNSYVATKLGAWTILQGLQPYLKAKTATGRRPRSPLQVNWKEDLLFRLVTLKIRQPSVGFVSEISRPNVVKTENYTCPNLC